MKLSDVAVKDPELLKWNVALKRWAPINPSTLSSGGRKDRDKDRDKDKDNDKDGADDLGEEDSDVGGGGTAENDTVLSNDRPILPTKDNPLTVAIYGQMCIAAKSYQSAICTSRGFFDVFIRLILVTLFKSTFSMHMIIAPKIL